METIKLYRFLFVLVVLLFISTKAFSEIIYDVDFSAPTHTVGSLPTTGSTATPSDTPSEIIIGTPLVDAEFNGELNQSLAFNSPRARSEAIGFDLGLGADRYTLEFDVILTSLNNPNTELFSVSFDTPTEQSVLFSNYSVDIFQPTPGGSTITGSIGNYIDRTAFNVLVDIDLVASSWSIFLDQSLAHSGAFFAFDTGGSTNDINRIRMSLFESEDVGDALAKVDNILIQADPEPVGVPAPASSLLLLVGLLPLLFLRRSNYVA